MERPGGCLEHPRARHREASPHARPRYPGGRHARALLITDVGRAARLTRRCVREAKALRVAVPSTVEALVPGLESWADTLGELRGLVAGLATPCLHEAAGAVDVLMRWLYGFRADLVGRGRRASAGSALAEDPCTSTGPEAPPVAR